ncbi:MAG TPA: DsrE/DsrF/DrsH-like family protein [Thermoplasmata archaeon]|nr:DsrE/DsrF/DrsH-like family protein [Thermoplasmata archaeon]
MSSATVLSETSDLHKDLGLTNEAPATPELTANGLSMVVFSGDLDKVLAAMIIANGAAAMDLPVSIFFTFWGLNVLRRGGPVHVEGKKTMVEGMFGRMMPRGPEHLQISKMKMAGLGTRMIKREMAKKHVATLNQLIQSAQDQGVRFIACTMSMDLMGIHKEELIPGIKYGNVGSFIDAADKSRITLFI